MLGLQGRLLDLPLVAGLQRLVCNFFQLLELFSKLANLCLPLRDFPIDLGDLLQEIVFGAPKCRVLLRVWLRQSRRDRFRLWRVYTLRRL